MLVFDSKEAALSVLNSIAGKVDEEKIKSAFYEKAKNAYTDELKHSEITEILDEYCELVGFEELCELLRDRRAEEYERGV